MANELNTVYTSGSTIYALIYRISDGYIWNGTTFVVWASASITSYDVPLASATGSDYYYADFPSTITGSGTYKVVYYLQAGASPAITDTKLEDEELTWSGTAVITSTTVLSAYALTTVEDVREAMNSIDTSNDDWIGSLINGWSARMERECGRFFKARDLSERYSGQYQRRLVLNNNPVISVERVAYGRGTAITASYTGTNIRASIQVTNDSVKLVNVSDAGVTTTSTFDFDTYPTTSLLSAAIGGVAGWSSLVSVNVPSVELNPSGGVNAISTSAYLTFPDSQDVEYWVDWDNGILSWAEPRWGEWSDHQLMNTMPAGFQNLLVNYRAGYETIPSDLSQLCIEFVTESFNMRNKNPSLISESLGDYAYKLAAQADIEARHKSLLSNYAKKRVGHYT